MLTLLKKNSFDKSIAFVSGYASPLGISVVKQLLDQGLKVLCFGKNFLFEENSQIFQNTSFFFPEAVQPSEERDKQIKNLCQMLFRHDYTISLMVNLPSYEKKLAEMPSEQKDNITKDNIIDMPGLMQSSADIDQEKEYRITHKEIISLCETVSDYMIEQKEGLILNVVPYQKPSSVGYHRNNDPICDYTFQLNEELSKHHASAKMVFAADPKTTLNFPYRRALSLKYSKYIRPFDESIVSSTIITLLQAYHNRVEYQPRFNDQTKLENKAFSS